MIVLYQRRKRKAKKEAQTIYIRNALVIAIAIGFYDEKPTDPEIEGYLADLDGIRRDIENIRQFYEGILNFDILPDYSMRDINTYRAEWKQDELVTFLKQKADYLEDNIQNNSNPYTYDGLVVVISCHGINDYILTSDYKKISKTAIHRIFSAKKQAIRQIPRMFIFDCCSGSYEKDSISRMDDESESESESDMWDMEEREHSKGIEVHDIHRQMTMVWARDEDNPDFKLIKIHAANEGFQSKMHMTTGSYVITKFTRKAIDNIVKRNNKKFLQQIFDEIQEELHQTGKQLMENTFNNKTGYIKFVRNKNSKIEEDESDDSDDPDDPGGIENEMMELIKN